MNFLERIDNAFGLLFRIGIVIVIFANIVGLIIIAAALFGFIELD